MWKDDPRTSSKVFVGSVPGYFSKSNILTIFSKLGQVKKVKIDSRNDNPNNNKGYCILTMQDTYQAQAIIGMKTINIGGGRYLVCKPYLRGQQLQNEIVLHDKRRIILKKIPIEISEQAIRDFCESRFGPVEVVFIFESDNQTVKALNKKRKNSASVTFIFNEDVDALFENCEQEQGIYLQICGYRIYAQRFIYQPPESTIAHSTYQNYIKSSNITGSRKQVIFESANSKGNITGSKNFNCSPEIDVGKVDGYIRDLNHKKENICFNILLKRHQPESTVRHCNYLTPTSASSVSRQLLAQGRLQVIRQE